MPARYYPAHKSRVLMYLETKFFLRKQRSGRYSIEVCLKNQEAQTKRKATGLVIEEKLAYLWRKKEGHFESIKSKKKDVLLINKKIERIQNFFEDVYGVFLNREIYEGIPFSLEEVFEKGMKRNEKIDMTKKVILIDSYKEFLNVEKARQNWSEGYHDNAVRTYKRLRDFLVTSEKTNISVDKFTYFDAKAYQHYVLSLNISPITLKNYTQLLKRYFLYAFDNQIINNNPIANLPNYKQNTKHQKARELTAHLTLEMRQKIIQNIDNQIFTKAEKTAAQIFLIQCETGLLWSDYKRLRKEKHYKKVGGMDFIFIKRTKSARLSQIPISPELNKLLCLFDWKLPIYSRMYFNKILKKVAKKSNIPFALSQKMGRTTFAYHYLNERGFSVGMVAKMLGHSAYMTEKHYSELGSDAFINELKQKL